MRMKEDAMLNGQLKPAYNIQHGGTLNTSHGLILARVQPIHLPIPFLKDMENHLGYLIYSEIVADAGYEAKKTIFSLRETDRPAYIKPQNYEISKTRKYKKDISRRENMEYHADRDSYICRNGKGTDCYK
ncbi:MAG: hypothetical protein V8S12_02980 [Lachnospiraceae bacterium]